MKKLLLAFSLSIVSLAFFSCQKVDPDLAKNTNGNDGIRITGREIPAECPPTVVDLIAGQYINSGSVTVSNDATYIYVTYTTSNGWVLTQTHLYVGNCALIPVTNSGNPVPGQFPYSTAHNNITTYTYQVPISAISFGTCGCIAAHAVVVKLGATGNVIDQQTAWGKGTRINPNGGNWGMKFGYCSCTPGS